jgi:hypothetical protein
MQNSAKKLLEIALEKISPSIKILFLVGGFFLSLSYFALAHAKPLPGEEVGTRSLAPISINGIGSISEKTGGFSGDLWRDTSFSTARQLLEIMPLRVDSPALRKLKKRFLLSSFTPISGEGDEQDLLFRLRLIHLAWLDDPSLLDQMVALVPASALNSSIAAIHVSGYFIAKQNEKACEKTRNYMPQFQRSGAIFWRQAMIFCQAFSNKKQEAELSLRLLQEDVPSISSDYVNLIQNIFAEDKNIRASAIEQWTALLRLSTAGITPIVQAFPAPNERIGKYISNFSRASWIKEHQRDAEDKKEANLTQLYLLADAAGAEITRDEWTALLPFVRRNNDRVSYVIAALLPELIAKKNTAEIISLVLIGFGSENLKNIDSYSAAPLIAALREIGDRETAQAITAELLP